MIQKNKNQSHLSAVAKQRRIKKVFVVYKRSVYQKYILDLSNGILSKLIKKRHPSTSKLLSTHKQHVRSLDLIRKTLKAHNIKYRFSSRSHSKNFKGYDLVITIGGDGTFLRASHYIKNQLMLGVNSVPTNSVGALCSITYNQFPKKLAEILDNKYKVKDLLRMKIQINGQPLPIEPINDILFTNYSPAATSRYIAKYNGRREDQKSSGIWVSTPLGSTAAMHAAGGNKQRPNDNRLQFFVREPFFPGKTNPYKIIHEFLAKKQKLKIMTKMLKSRIYLDGPTVYYSMEYGDELSVSLSKNTLRVIT